jgi:MarR family transcriptional regulator for hemolysin
MSTASTQRGAPGANAPRSNFEIYRDGGTTPEIRLTINLVIVARKWRSLTDEKLRLLFRRSMPVSNALTRVGGRTRTLP